MEAPPTLPPTSSSSSSSTATTTTPAPAPGPAAFPKLPRLPRDPPTPPPIFTPPSKRIHDGPDVARFLVSAAYRDIGTFVLQLNRAVCPRRGGAGGLAATTTTYTLASPRADPPSIRALQALLARVGGLVAEAPPEPGPRRFGNVAFRKWFGLLERQVEGWLGEFVDGAVLDFGGGEGGGGVGAGEELKAYLLGAFGSAQRLDYGTGHELSFLAFLGGLWKLGAFADGEDEEGVERSIVLGVIEPYLGVVRKLILTYNLEPAGSHGVWGLDDHSFLPYIFGSAQLTRPIAPQDPMPQEGSAPRAPKTAAVTDAAAVAYQRDLNMYFSAVGFINDVKKGPFWEHSPILFDVSGIRDGWGKINKGMIKMYNAEVLSKFPVVQHFPFGTLFSWDRDPDAAAPPPSMHVANQPAAAAASGGSMPPPPVAAGSPGTAAPWAQATRMPGTTAGPGIPYSRVGPGASSTGAARPPPTGPVRRAPGQMPRQPAAAGAQMAVTKAPWAKE